MAGPHEGQAGMSFHGHNGTGPDTVLVSRERDFAIFDELPPRVRKALNEAVFKYCAAEVAATVITFGEDRIAAAIPTVDQRMLNKERAGAS